MDAQIVLAGDLNQMSDAEVIVHTGMSSIVMMLTKGYDKLDRIYVTDYDYNGVKVLKSAINSDHIAIIAYCEVVDKKRRMCTFRKHGELACSLLSRFSTPVHIVNHDADRPTVIVRSSVLYAMMSDNLTSPILNDRYPSHMLIHRTSFQLFSSYCGVKTY